MLRNVIEAPRSARAQWLAAIVLRFRGRIAEYQGARAAYLALSAERGLDLEPP